jgi:hypothetical protein
MRIYVICILVGVIWPKSRKVRESVQVLRTPKLGSK